jgi:thioredoxin-related protein
MNFTGSDWCGWCKKLQKEVFATKEFEQYAKANVVLVEIDFPDKKPQTQQLKAANEALQGKFKAEGYPTIVVLDKDGKEVWRQGGYLAGGPAVWIEKLNAAKKK